MPRGRRVCLAAGLVCSVWSAGLVATRDYGGLPFVAWLASLLLARLGLPRDEAPRRALGSTAVAFLVLISCVAAFLRVHALEAAPSGLWKDEVDIVRNALNLAAKPFVPFGMTPLRRADWVKTSNLYLYACWLVLAASRFSLLGVKLISILPGVAAPPLLYLLSRRFLSPSGAVVAGGLLAASLWQVTLSRWGWDEMLVTALAIPVFAALWDATRGSSARSYWVGGVLAGISLYAYLSSRLLVVAAISFLLWRWAWRRGKEEARGLGLFLLGLALAALPTCVYWIHDPDSFLVRIRQLWYVGSGRQPWLGPLIHSVAAHLLMFHAAGDVNPRHNVPGVPMLDPISGALFLLGLAAAVAAWRRAESQIALCWIGIGLLGGILSDPSEAPQAYRTGLIAPACYLVAGLGWDALCRVALTGKRLSAVMVPAGAALLVVFPTVLTYRLYFVARARSQECWSSVDTGASSELAREAAVRELDIGEVVLLDRSVDWPALALEVDRLHWKTSRGAIRWVRAPKLQPTDLHGAILLMAPEAWARLPPRLQGLPSRPVRNRFGRTILVGLSTEPTALADLI